MYIVKLNVIRIYILLNEVCLLEKTLIIDRSCPYFPLQKHALLKALTPFDIKPRIIKMILRIFFAKQLVYVYLNFFNHLAKKRFYTVKQTQQSYCVKSQFNFLFNRNQGVVILVRF